MHFSNYIMVSAILGVARPFSEKQNIANAEYNIYSPGPGVQQLFMSDGEFIRKAVAKIPLERFVTYPILVQTYLSDPSPLTQYRRDHGKHLIFQENEDQREITVIIIHRNEHSNMFSNGHYEGRTYIVLIQNVRSRNKYHALYCYVSEVPGDEKLDSGIIMIDRVKKRIEWDSWELRNENRNKAVKFGWVTCLESLLVPCKEHFPEEDDQDHEGNVHGPIGAFAEFTDKTERSEPPPHASKKIIFERTIKTDYGTDLYDDLDDTNREALFIGATIETVLDTHSFFVDAIHDFSGNQHLTLAEMEMKAVSTTLSKGFYELIMLDLKTVGNYSYSRFEDNPSMSTLLFLSEGYRIIKGLLKNATALDLAMELTHEVFNGASPINDRKIRHRAESRAGLALEPVQAQLLRPGLYPTVGGRGSVNGDSFVGAHGRGPLQLLIGKSKTTSTRVSESEAVEQELEISLERKKRDALISQDFLGTGTKPDRLHGIVGGNIKGTDWREFCARTNLTPGEQGWCGCHKGKDVSFGAAEKAGDFVGLTLANQTVSNNTSVLDPIFNTVLATAYCGTSATIIDAGVEALGAAGLGMLSQPLGQVANLVGAATGITGGGPYMVANLAHQGIKVIGAMSGLGGLIGMQGFGIGRAADGNENEQKVEQRKRSQEPIHQSKFDYLPNVESHVDVFGQLGWRTQDVSDLDDLSRDIVASDFDRLPYIGFGNCPYIRVTPGDFRRAEGLQDVGKLFHTVMRTYCSEKQARILQDIFDEGGLVLNWDKTISINTDWKSLSEIFLTEREFDRLSMAFSLSIFSLSYLDPQVTKDSHFLTAIKSTMNNSNSAGFLVNYAAQYMEHAHEIAAEHYVKLTRDLVYTLKTAFIKTLQDYYRLKNCEQCPLYLTNQIRGDAFTLLGIIQFIIDGQASIEHFHQTPAAAISKFFSLNGNLLRTKLSLYTGL